jgi:pimeloyl-ACP methyl ester carboxylesterase
MRTVHGQPPTATGRHHGLAWARFDPDASRTPHGAVVILHGADSVKENQFDFARAAAHAGLVAIGFDARGHGETGGELGGGALDDIAAMADLARAAAGGAHARLALRGSSMGGYLALVAAAPARADAVVAICPPDGELLRRGLQEPGRFAFACDRPAVTALLDRHDVRDAVAALAVPLLLMHAAGDLSVPVEHSRELAALAQDARYVELPGGHHQSVQHDAELLGVSVRFLARSLRAAAAG